jgi:hypothetical protein
LFKRADVEVQLRDQDRPASVWLRPLGANPEPALQPGVARQTVLHDFRGQDPERWHSNIPSYHDLRYVDIYPGVDLAFRTHDRQLAYDFVVHPGADPDQIRVAVEGASHLRIAPDGSLLATLPDGHTFAQQAPVIYQDLHGKREPVSGRFRLVSASSERSAPVYGFEIGAYDPSRTLTIDPTLNYASFVGGSSDESVSAMHVTSSGATIVAGTTESSDIPGAVPVDAPGGSDGFIYKMNVAGNGLDFVVLLGGSDDEELHDIAIGSDDSIYVTGATSSEDFPLANPLFGVLTGRSDAFITKLDASGVLGSFSTYYGGNGETVAKSIALDQDDNIYVAGVTAAPDLVLRNALHDLHAGDEDGFILRFAADGLDLDYATYFGGSDSDSIDHLIVSKTGDLFLAGTTSSPATTRDGLEDFPVKNALQPVSGGDQDAFLARIARGGIELVFSTYLGGSGEDTLSDFALDADGNYLLAGYTDSEDWPTENAILPDYPFDSGEEIGTVAKVDRSGRFLHFATYLGAAGIDRALAVASLDGTAGSDAIYVAGTTESNAFPVQNPYQNYHAGNGDGFLMMLDASGQIIEFSTYFGGSAVDQIHHVQPHPTSTTSIFFAGVTPEERNSVLFPVGSVPSINAHSGGDDTFLGRLDGIIRDPDLPMLWLDTDLSPLHPEAPSISPPEVTFTLRLRDRPAPALGVTAFSAKIYYDANELQYDGVAWESGTVLDDLQAGQEKVVVDHGNGEIEVRILQQANPGRLDNGLTDDKIATLTFGLVNVGNTADDPPLPSQLMVVHVEDLSPASVENNLDAVINGLPGSRLVERRCNALLGDCDCSGRVQLFEVHAGVQYFLTANDAAAPICVKHNYETLGSGAISTIINHYLDADVEEGVEPNDNEMGMGLLSASTLRGPISVYDSDVDRLDFESLSAAGNPVKVDLRLDAVDAPSVLSADLRYDPALVASPPIIYTAQQVLNVDKRAEYNQVAPGWVRILVYGINKTAIPNGVVATVKMTLASDKDAQDITLGLEATAAGPAITDDVVLASNSIARGEIGCSDEAKENVTKAYIGYYNRCPDSGGMDYWCGRLDRQGGGRDLGPIIAPFGTSQEYTERFSGLPEDVLINNLYQNMFGRDAETAGLGFYVNLLGQWEQSWRDQHGRNQGATEYALSRIALDVINGAQGNDAEVLLNRVEACR